MTFAYLVLHIVLDYPNRYVLPPLLSYVVLFPILIHRYARALWLTLDCFFDHTDLEQFQPREQPPAVSPAPPSAAEDPN